MNEHKWKKNRKKTTNWHQFKKNYNSSSCFDVYIQLQVNLCKCVWIWKMAYLYISSFLTVNYEAKPETFSSLENATATLIMYIH